MICQHSHQLLFVLGFEQVFDGSRRSLAKASSVGAETIKGPLPFKVFTSPAAFTAATKVLNCPERKVTKMGRVAPGSGCDSDDGLLLSRRDVVYSD